MKDKKKYPRIYHCPWSPNLQNDDRLIETMEYFVGKRVIKTLKIDGENANLSKDYYHARSLDTSDHPSRHWIKSLWSSIRWEIPDGWVLTGENAFALHSVFYTNLPSYFLLFGIFDENYNYLPWDEVAEWAKLLNLETVPVLYDGIYNEEKIRKFEENKNETEIKGWGPKEGVSMRDIYEITDDDNTDLDDYFFEDFRHLIIEEYPLEKFAQEVQEGYVLRIADGFSYNDFDKCICKNVRKNFVKTSDHWMSEVVIPNRLKN